MSWLTFTRHLGAISALAIALAACGHGGATVAGPTRPASSWAGQDADLFDDGIDVGAIPIGGAAANEKDRDEANDERVPNRVEKADGVVVGKVIGVSSEPVGDHNRFRLELTIEGDPLAGAHPDTPFTLVVESSSPAFGTVRSQDAQLIGKKFVVYFRRYAGEEGGEPITHYHLSPTTDHVLDLIQRANTKRKVEEGLARPGPRFAI